MGHRRVHSEIYLRFPDEVSFGGSMDGGDNEADDLLATYMDMEKIEYCAENRNNPMNNNAPQDHDHDLDLDLDLDHDQQHRHCFTMDEFSGFSSNNDNDNDYSKINNNNNYNAGGGGGGASLEAKKAMPPDKLAELWVADPKRAKRILANRQSAARSKERKARYMQELEKRVKSLQTEATALSVQLSLFKRDTGSLTSENIDLRRQLESMEQQAQLRDALNDALKQELDRLAVATGDASTTADTFVMPLQNVPHHSQQQQQQQHQRHQQHQQQHQQQQSACLFESNMMSNPHQIDSKMSCLHPFELNISHTSQALDSHQTEILHSSHQSVDQHTDSNIFNMPQQPKVQQHCLIGRKHYLPFEPSRPRVPQYSTTKTNMNYPTLTPPVVSVSPLGHLPPYSLESNNSQSPEQQVYVTSQPHLLSQMTKQDHITKTQALDMNNAFDSYQLVKIQGMSIIANENIKGF
ncbi:hypothetical protein SOVF_051660 [Spinacia oleracea]|uniref:Transcription factor RF2b n=1 Tax=Spinacia oleracea TaxID=3562 RepID=A0ABM3R4X2_SPIOL|nr:transcription factor RF2b-like [Spinacia oleracea]KNA20511.1 hypothetical protein SOVF_051660 [Spinacia oleracea]